MTNAVVFILGPTSSGKSEVAVRVAEELSGEIISCDSMQIYKDMDVVTRPPGDDLLRRVSHHLVKMLPLEEEFNAARFVLEAEIRIRSLMIEGKMPIVTGGTGLYVKSLIDGIFSSPPKDDQLRSELDSLVKEKGKEHLHQKLKEVDPAAAERLHVNDVRRVIRALEVYNLTGRTISEKQVTAEGISKKYDCLMFGLKMSKQVLHARINSVVEKMFTEGLVEEVKNLMKRNLSLTAGKALGIKEIAAFLHGETDLPAAKEELKKNTRKYAKRQMTWFRGDKRIVWIDADRDPGEVVSEIVESVRD